ncbi:hypothetical protein BSLG_005757 [Batrachochytrium salamandrivorans]|nr:hypothetical protein BSLG_005757 [Batrachochytrium salamandrivorans]
MTPRLAAWIRGIYDSFESQSELALHTIVQLYTISSCFVQEMHTRLSTFQLQPDQQDSSLSVKAFLHGKLLVLECFIPTSKKEIDKYVVAIANVAIHTLQFLQAPSNTHALIVAGQAATASSLASGNTGNSNTGQDNVPYTSGFASDATDGVYGQDEEWADFRAAVAVHTACCFLDGSTSDADCFIWTAMDRSASTCFSTTDTNDTLLQEFI